MIKSMLSFNDFYNEDKIKDLALIRIMKGVPDCLVMQYGLKKIPMDVYYCNCDKDHKFTICEACIKSCHSHHSQTDFLKSDPNHMATCMCGVKSHKIIEDSEDSHRDNIQCYFHELSFNSQNFEYYEARNGIQICTFCKLFCYRKSKDSVDYTKLKFVKQSLTKADFEKKLRDTTLKCSCPEIPGSLHRLANYLTLFLSNFNIPRPGHFKGLSSVHLINLFFHSTNVFQYFNLGFINEYDRMKNGSSKTENDNKLDKKISSTNLFHGYINFSVNAQNCRENYYFSDDIRQYYDISVVEDLLNRKMEDHPTVYKFYSALLLGLKKFRIDHDFENLPKYKFIDFANMSPFQRLINNKSAVCYNRKALQAYRFDNMMKKSSFIDVILDFMEKMVRMLPESVEATYLFIEVSSIVKKFAKFYLLSQEQMIKFSNSVDEYFYFIAAYSKRASKRGKKMDNAHRMAKAKGITNILKCLIFFAIGYNDMNVNRYVTVASSVQGFAFFHSYNDLGRIITKNMIHMINYVQNELEEVNASENQDEFTLSKVNIGYKKKIARNNSIKEVPEDETSLGDDDDGMSDRESDMETESEAMENLKYKEKITKIVLISSNLISMALHRDDFYLIGLKRSINSYLSSMIKYSNILTLSDTHEQEFLEFLDFETKYLEESYFFYFLSPAENLPLLSKKVLESVSRFFERTNNIDVRLPSNHENDISFSIENKEEENEGTVRKGLIGSKHSVGNLLSYSRINRNDDNKNCTGNASMSTLLTQSNYFYTLTKFFTFGEDRQILSLDIVENILKVLYIFIQNSPDNCILGLSIPVLNNLSHISAIYADKALDYIIHALKQVSISESELAFTFQYIDIAIKMHKKSEKFPNKASCLLRVFKILKLISEIPISNKNQLLHIFRNELMDLWKTCDIISLYKNYLLNISEDYIADPKYYLENKEFDKETIFQTCFKDVTKRIPSFKMGIAFKIYLKFIKLMNDCFDDNAMKNYSPILSQVLNSSELLQILKVTTLHLSLRIELIKFFRMTYVDVSIEEKKITEYHEHFKKDLESHVAVIGDSLLPVEDMKIFSFLGMLMSISGINMTSKETKNELELLMFEISHIDEIINLSRGIDNKIYVKYIESGILLPIKVFVNKIFSIVMNIEGKDFLKLYQFCYYLLVMKTFILQKNFFFRPDQDNISINGNHKGGVINESHMFLNQSAIDQNKRKSVIKEQRLNTECLKDVEDDIKLITSANFQPLNYLQIYNIIIKHIMSLIQHPTSKELVIYFTEYKTYQSDKINDFVNKLNKRGIKFSQEENKKMLELIRQYFDQKNEFEKSSIRSSLNENHTDLEMNFRTLLVKFLFFLSSPKIFTENFYAKESKEIILDLLKNETAATQQSVLDLSQKKSEKSEKEHEQAVHEYSYLTEYANSAFKNILSIIFQQYNPTIIELPDDYYNACHIIKVFKFLCEEHNKKFQKILLTEVYFQMKDNRKTMFYDMMLYILDKIIALTGWEKVKGDEEGIDYYYGLFSCIIEMLIEIVQGTDPENFSSLYFGETRSEDGEEHGHGRSKKQTFLRPLELEKHDPTFEKGKALPLFLNNIKNLLLNSKAHSETIYKIRKELVDFLLAFMEEYSCPLGIKKIIMSSYHPNKIMKSISTILRQYYLSRNGDGNNFQDSHPVNQNRRKISGKMIYLSKSSTHNRKKDKRLKRLKFNERLYTYFENLYFDDNEFAVTAEFQLCSGLYSYFKLCLLQYKFEESKDYWTKIKNLSVSAINDFNIRSNQSDEEKSDKPIQDESDYEAYYVCALFEKITKSVFVKIPSSKKPVVVVYTMTPYLKYLSINSKEEFLRDVNRSDRYSKLYELMEHSEYFTQEIAYNWNNIRNQKFLRRTTEFNYYIISMLVFLYATFLNISLLSSLHESGKSYIGGNSLRNVQAASYVLVILDFFFIIIWGVTKMPLYYEIEKAKYKEGMKIKISESMLEDKDLTLWDKANIRVRMVLTNRDISSILFVLIFIVIGSSRDDLTFLYPFSLLSVVSLSRTLSNIALSIVLKAKQLLWTLIFTFVILYVWAAWGYFFEVNRFYDIHERPVPEQTCASLIYCWLTVMNQGLRWHAGIGKILPNESGYKEIKGYTHRWFYDFLFFLLVVIIMLHIVFGIILDTFRELRKKQYEIDKDIANKCFICNIKKDECEKNNRNFRDHCEKEHNVWEYTNYMITLRMKEVQDLNSINSYCKEQIMKKNINWIPDKKDEAIEEMEEEEEESEEEHGHHE